MRLCLWSSLLCCLCSGCLIKKSCEWGKKKNQTATKTLVDFPIFFNLLELLCLLATVSLLMSYFTRHSMFSSASTLIQFSPVRFCSINGNLEVLCCYYCFYYCCFVCVCIEVNWMTASASDALQWKVFRWRQFIGYSSSSFAYIRLMSGTAGSACLPVSVCLCFWPASKCHQKHRFFFCHFSRCFFTVPKVAAAVTVTEAKWMVCVSVCSPFWRFSPASISFFKLPPFYIVFLFQPDLSTLLATVLLWQRCTLCRQLTFHFNFLFPLLLCCGGGAL